jgi:hypothetical protein
LLQPHTSGAACDQCLPSFQLEVPESSMLRLFPDDSARPDSVTVGIRTLGTFPTKRSYTSEEFFLLV